MAEVVLDSTDQSDRRRSTHPASGLIYSHTATPEGAITAPVGSLCLNTGGGAETVLYMKETGTGNTGWSAMAGV